MLVTISDIDGIKQFQVTDHIKKVIVVLIVVVVLFMASIVWYISHLSDRVVTLSTQSQTNRLQEQQKSATLTKRIKSLELQYNVLFETKEQQEKRLVAKIEQLKEENNKFVEQNAQQEKRLLAKIAQLEKQNRTLDHLLKARTTGSVKYSKQLKRQKKELATLRKELKALQKKLTKTEALNKKLTKAAQKNEKKIAKLLKENATQKKALKTHIAKQKKSSAHNYKARKDIFRIAKKELGKRYVWGSVGPRTFDCSGFTSYVYKKVGINIPRTSRQQAKYGKLVKRSELKPGDLIFFDTDLRRRGIDHVGIYIGNNKFIHASSARKKVIITSLNKSFYKRRFRLARRVD